MKTKISNGLMLAFAVFAFCFSAIISNAQTGNPPQNLAQPNTPAKNEVPPQPIASAPTAPPNTVDCFNYYKFGSVQVSVDSSINSTISGVPLTLTGKVINQNNYPIVDGAIYIKVFRKSVARTTQANGFDLVDQFFAKENISLDANQSKNITFEWKIPTYAVTGDYQIATFFTSAKKFNLSGLTFTDDIVGNTFDFKVKGENLAIVSFDKTAVTLNSAPFHFAAFLQKFKKDESVAVSASLQNQTNLAQDIPVTWTLYSWDAQRNENKIDSKKETIQLDPNSSKVISYTVLPQSFPVSFLVAEADYKDTKSILDIRFANKDVQKTRINFPAVTTFPLKKGTAETIFSCLHNSGTADTVGNNKFVMDLIDQNGKTIHSYTYAGDITGRMMGVKDEFAPDKDYDNFILKAQLYTDGKLIDSAQMKYDCKEIDPAKCSSGGAENTNLLRNSKISSSLILISLIMLLTIIGLLAVIIHKRKSSR